MKKNSIFRWGVAMLLLFTGLSLRAYAEDDGGSPFRKNHDVDLTVKSATLQTFTDAFTKQTGVLFSYESALASMPMGDVSVRESNAPLERILNNVFTKRGFRYKIVDRTVVLTYDRTAEPQRKNSVTGRVCDAAGSPLVGATVLAAGLAGWLGEQLLLPTCVSVLLSAIAIRFVLNFIPFVG